MTLEGLKAACRDAADKDSKVEDFEIGVFNGNYVTGVPEGYFEHLSSMRKGKKRKADTLDLAMNGSTDSSGDPMVVANSGPVYGADPEYREDIRFVAANIRHSIC